jgi:uncharacterized membrane protein YbhN (UPF0104 family)
MRRKNSSGVFSFIIKILVLVLTFLYIYKEIICKSELEDIKRSYFQLFQNKQNLLTLVLVLLLMGVNWSLEAYKWRLMIAKIEGISFFRSLKAVFSGVTVSLFTPNRIGEYGGRVFYLKPEDRVQGVFITMLSSMSQLLVTLLTGLVALIFFIPKYQLLNPYLYYSIIIISLALLVLLLFFYFNIYLLNTFLLKISWLKKAEEYIHVLMLYDSKELAKVFLLSLIRYLVFTIQYYLLLQLFQVYIPLSEGAVAISLSFLVMTLIPTFTLAEIGIRGSVCAYFIGFMSTNSFGILTASFTLWLVNLVLPALMGAFLILRLRLFK